MALDNLSIYYRLRNIKYAYNNNKFKISASTWNDDLPDGLYSILDIQDYFECIVKKHETWNINYNFAPIKPKTGLLLQAIN